MAVLQRGIANELLLYDVKPHLADGEALDFAHGSSFYPSARVRAVEIEQMRGADAVIIAAGRNSGPGESRLTLLADNARIVSDVCARLRGFDGLLVVVTNPVDVLTHVALEASGLDPARVLGTGTMLDTARLRQMLGRELDVDPRSVHAQVIGEHGDSEVTLWSSASVGGRSLRTWRGWSGDREAHLAAEVRGAAYAIIERKGATNHAIGLVTASLLGCALRDEKRVLAVSRLQSGAAGIAGVALSLPAIVGRNGAREVIEPEMDELERAALTRSADVLRQARASLA